MYEIYDRCRPLYQKTDASGVGLGAQLLQMRDGMKYGHDEVLNNVTLHSIIFASRSLSNTDRCYSSIEYEALRILHGPEMVHQCCFVMAVHIITDHKVLVAICSMDMAVLSQKLQCIMLRIHQYRVCIIYKPGPDLYIAYWLFWNKHAENRGQKITS